MVNTRRMESGGSAPHSSPRHRTRSTVLRESETSSISDTDEKENLWDSPDESKIHSESNASVPQVRELRSRFVLEAERDFSPKRLRRRQVRSSHITLSKRNSLSVYSNRNMHDDSDCSNTEDEQIFSSRARKARHPRHSKRTLSQLEKRTALSLRPISIISYADPHSPLTYNSDDSDADKDVVRRSKRKRTSCVSWLTDNQMPKVGYPNMDIEDYSEEDSRDMEDTKRRKSRRTDICESRRVTREVNGISSRRTVKKNSKYLYDYETTDVPRNRNHKTQNETSRVTRNLDLRTRSRLESMDNKENKETNVADERVEAKDIKTEEEEEDQDVNADAEEESKIEEIKTTNDKSNDEHQSQDDQEDRDRSSRKIRTRRKNTSLVDDSYSPKCTTRGRKVSDSSSSSEVNNKVYSLRQRVPKPSNKPKTNHTIRTLRTRKCFTRRKVVSTDTDSTDSEDLVRKKPSKYQFKNQKGSHGKSEHLIKSGAGTNKPMPIGPETVDNKVRFTSVGGLDGHVRCLKEMILLPMMYPEVFLQFQIQPPRGVLFHGPPGTGKTLIARALANECSFGSRKVSFFMRKGADLLCKWVGESEKQLRLLFEQANELKPSIIFFDELDGLAPVRSSRQDQIHASIVSTLLALMDGLENRGEVIVIGATNRIDAIDPALRRPGRFDRELFFPLPARIEREEILNVHVAQWTRPPSPSLVSYLAESAIGYCGSDLRALCSEAVIQSLRRIYPQVYTADHRLLLDPSVVEVEKVDFLRAKSLLVPASQRIVQPLGRKMLAILEPLLGKQLKEILNMLKLTFPHGLEPALAKVKLAAGFRPAQLLLVGDGPQHGQTLHLAPGLLNQMEHIHAHVLDLAMLYRETARSPEEACLQVFQEAKRNIPSVIYIPNIDELWNLVPETVKCIFLSQLHQMDPNIPLLLLGTANVNVKELPIELQNLFSQYRREVYELNAPNLESRRAFFKPLIIDACIRTPKPPRKRVGTPPPLPKAPTPPPTPMTEENAKKLYDAEECTLRELRIFLRDICKKLANNKMFFMFTKPVDTEEVPDYTSIIKQPMDLETMMTKVDLHRYECAKDFLTDIELIVQNALEYNPARTSADKQIRHRACSLRDYAHALIKNEMDSDFEISCQKISTRRVERKASVSQYLPPYINTAEGMAAAAALKTEKGTVECEINGAENGSTLLQMETSSNDTPQPVEVASAKNTPANSSNVHVRRRKYSSWQRGDLKKKKKLNKTVDGKTSPEEDLKEGEQNDSKECSSSFPYSSDSTATNGNGILIKAEVDSDLEATTPKLNKSKERKSSLIRSGGSTTVHDNSDAINNDSLNETPINKGLTDELTPNNTEVTNKKNTPNSTTTRKRKYNSWARGDLKKKKRDKINDEKISPDEDLKDDEPENKESPILFTTAETIITNGPSLGTIPLSVDCDSAIEDTSKSTPSSSLKSPSKRRLSDLFSPSELLDDPLEFDDIDKALNENVSDNILIENKVDIDVTQLETVLDDITDNTVEHSLESLLDLHSQLSRIVRKYSRTRHRQNLPEELHQEFLRFKDNPPCSGSLTD